MTQNFQFQFRINNITMEGKVLKHLVKKFQTNITNPK